MVNYLLFINFIIANKYYKNKIYANKLSVIFKSTYEIIINNSRLNVDFLINDVNNWIMILNLLIY